MLQVVMYSICCGQGFRNTLTVSPWDHWLQLKCTGKWILFSGWYFLSSVYVNRLEVMMRIV
jgi:hypothetical protein